MLNGNAMGHTPGAVAMPVMGIQTFSGNSSERSHDQSIPGSKTFDLILIIYQKGIILSRIFSAILTLSLGVLDCQVTATVIRQNNSGFQAQGYDSVQV